jgi:addiction module RelE/StbE family toxin
LRLIWSRTALRHLRAIHAHIADDKPNAATQVIERIKASAERLGRFPLSGRSGEVAGSRELVVPGLPYIVVYEVSPLADAVLVLGVFHGARER